MSTSAGQQQRCAASGAIDTAGERCRLGPRSPTNIEQSINRKVVVTMKASITIDEQQRHCGMTSTIEWVFTNRVLREVVCDLGSQRIGEFHLVTMAARLTHVKMHVRCIWDRDLLAATLRRWHRTRPMKPSCTTSRTTS